MLTTKERNAIPEEDQVSVVTSLEALRSSLIKRIGLEDPGSDIGADDGVIATIRARWTRLSTVERTTILHALHFDEELPGNDLLGDLRFVDSENKTALRGLESSHGVDFWNASLLTWCSTVLTADDAGVVVVAW